MAGASGSVRAAYLRGIVGALPFLIVVAPFGLLFGVVATEAGMDVAQALAFSVLVIAGAAQFTAVQLLADGAPAVIAVMAALAVNLRTAMYSAALTPHLGAARFPVRAFAAYFVVDQSFAASLAEYERRPDMSSAEKLAFFFGTTTPVTPVWYLSTLAGALLGRGIPPEYALDFAVPITFLAVTAPMVRTLAHLVAVGVSVAAALALAWLPYSGGLLIAAALAMISGAEVERRMAPR